ncbi:hypothetical protein N7456_001907 [Penicillium angulare]|uniref:Pentatricopeptide repeat protein n=1 Tax=Penicillium angulare TaxID=116970 RepID=A0A9W9G7M5_9EURO|nr:hypothetical protein N7456_001907 [Penicillium angulare]
MPHSIRSPSSPSLRDPYKPALDDPLVSRPNSMSHQRPPLSRSSSIRTFSTRRSRPSVASIADVFVGSLVLAGFCHEHSPRGRGLSTISLAASEIDRRRFRKKDRKNHNEIPCRGRWQFSAFSVHPSQPQSRLGHGLAQVEEVRSEEPVTEFTNIEGKGEEDNSHMLPRLPEIPDSKTQQCSEDHYFDTIPSNLRLIIPPKENSHYLINQEDPTEPHMPEKPSPRRDERVQKAISSLLMRHLGWKYNWKKVFDELVPKPTFVRSEDQTRDAIEIASVAALVEALPSRKQFSAQQLFNLYRQMPTPGVAYLSKLSRGTLLRRLAMPPNQRWSDSRRYLALVNDMIAAGLPMSLSMWTSAIHMAGQSNNGKVSKRRLIQAIGLWQHMEHFAGIRADNVVFTTLFDTAIKAGQFVVASRLEDEMHKRGKKFGREGLVSKILYYGIQKDSDGISATFETFIQSGELVDTVVLNALIGSYLRAGEVETAEHLYKRMMHVQTSRYGGSLKSNPRFSNQPSLRTDFSSYRAETKTLGRLLKMAPRLKKNSLKDHTALQNSLPMTPDTRTFYILLRYYARETGDLDMFMSILRDMERTFEVPPRHVVYLFLFEGFAAHGRRKKAWSVERLRRTWLGFIDAVRDSRARVFAFDLKNPHMTWENPLVKEDPEVEDPAKEISDDSSSFYIPLPSTSTEAHHSTPEQSSPVSSDSVDALANSEKGQDSQDSTNEEGSHAKDHVFEADMDDPDNSLNRQDIDHAAKRLQNGVFVGRQMAIAILRAFGCCCGPRAVTEVWSQLEPMWNSENRKESDTAAVKDVLDQEMSRPPRRM